MFPVIIRWGKANMKMTTVGKLNHTDFKLAVVASNKSSDGSGFHLILHRKPKTYIWLYFFPSFMMVLTSWISFAVSFEAVPGRLGLLLTLLLMMINMNNNISVSIPKSEMLCPLVQWVLMCKGFIIFALLEYFIILIKVKFGGAKKKMSTREAKQDHNTQNWIYGFDKTSLVAFPCTFFVCVLLFTIVHLLQMEETIH